MKIDATDKILGRLASEIVIFLRGKNKANFQPRLNQGEGVEVINVDQMRVTGKKMDDKIYYKHTGYLGHLKKMPMKVLFKKDSREVLRKAIYGMLPKNKLRPRMMKKLKLFK